MSLRDHNLNVTMLCMSYFITFHSIKWIFYHDIYNNRCTKFIAGNVLAILLSNVVFERYPLSLLDDIAKLFLCQRQHVIFFSYATNTTERAIVQLIGAVGASIIVGCGVLHSYKACVSWVVIADYGSSVECVLTLGRGSIIAVGERGLACVASAQ